MKRKRIDYDLQVKVCKYLEHIWLEEELENGPIENAILNKLSEALKKDLLIQANGRALASSPTFSGFFSDETLERAAQCLKVVHFAPGDIIFRVIIKINYYNIIYNSYLL